MNNSEQELEVDRNYDIFVEHLAMLMVDHPGEYVLMREGRMVSFHPSAGVALAAGRQAFSDSVFSIQEVTDRPIDLGFFSHAIDSRIA